MQKTICHVDVDAAAEDRVFDYWLQSAEYLQQKKSLLVVFKILQALRLCVWFVADASAIVNRNWKGSAHKCRAYKSDDYLVFKEMQ